ncbi:MAG: BACON domain-containing carbohydrate-binding protein [Bacteroidota bacterium]
MKNITSILLIIIAILGIQHAYGQDEAVKPTSFSTAVYFDRIGPLKDFPPMTAEDFKVLAEKEKNKVRNKDLQYRSYPFASTALPKGPDQAWQKENGNTHGVENIIENFNGQNTGSYPPDCNGSAGPEHFFQTINTTYAIYEKNGTQIVPPTNLNTLFAGVPGSGSNDGDPILLYDDIADRWLAAEFSGVSGPDYMMIAISVTNDPTGDWYRWSWTMNGFPDYMKFGVWEDGYYMGTNTSSGSDIYVFEREEMLIGGEFPQKVQFDNPWRPNSGFHCVLPADCDGDFAPSGTPGIFLTINDDAWGGSDQLWMFELDVDWDTPGNSTWDRTQQIDVTPFDSNFGPTWDNISQKGTGQKLDAINQILMYRVQYRNFGDDKRLVCIHTVDVDGTDHAGIRWYELDLDGSDWSIRQEGTYAPDEHSRWMGSIAMNGSREIALGYSISSSTLNPGIRYCGQSSAENIAASGIMDIAEGTIKDGTVSQTSINRWGDYSNMSVDPSDDKTFWYTTQFMNSSSSKGTKIASLYFDELLFATFTATPTNVFVGGTVNFIDQSMGDPTTWEWTFEGGEPATSSDQNPSVIYNTAGDFDVTLTVTNTTGSNTMLIENYITAIDEVLTVTPSSTTVSMGSGSTEIVLDASKGWSATVNCDWATTNPSGGLGGGNVLISYDENTGTQRECIISFATATSSVDFILVQEGIAEILTLDPVSQTVDYLASSINISLVSNTTWDVIESCDWLSITPESGHGDAILTISFDENMSFEDRECKVNIAANNTAVEFTLLQTATPASITTNISSDIVDANASSIEIEVISNVDWVVDEQCDWLTVTPASGIGTTIVTIEYTENESFIDQRECQINFNGDGTSANFELVQQTKIAELALNTNEQNVGWQVGNFDVDVTTNTDWSVSTPCEWITVDPESGSLSGSFTLNYIENTETNERSCTVSVSGGGLVQELTINQEAHPDGIDELMANQISLFPNPASQSFTIESEKSIDKIQVVDLLGKLIIEFENPALSTKIHTSDWKKGTYYVRITQNKTVITGTVLIQ